MSERKDAVKLFVVIAIVSLFADLASKHAVWYWVDDPEIVVVPSWLSIIQRLNTGGIWSMFHDVQSANTMLAVFSSIAIIAIIGLAWSAIRAKQYFLPILLGAILGGALGNLHDRWLYGGVRDWIDVNLQFYRWPTFNLADSFLVCGAIGLFLHSLLTHDPQEEKSQPVAAPDTAEKSA